MCRKATHAGSWYDDDGESIIWNRRDSMDRFLFGILGPTLDAELQANLEAVTPDANQPSLISEGEVFVPPVRGCKAIIAPHAGYLWSGPAAAWAYKCIDTTGM
ncbi:hypothetical protein FRC02_001627 [Tulasnella sp. 418]|nr:hypothetical protein FRC02_001627 [Tulasnella sp. 418]